MAERIDNVFTQYEFGAAELREAAIFNPLQLQFLQTEAAIAANELLILAPDPESPTKFMLERENIRGRLQQLQWLIVTSESLKNERDEDVLQQLRVKQAQAAAQAVVRTYEDGEKE